MPTVHPAWTSCAITINSGLRSLVVLGEHSWWCLGTVRCQRRRPVSGRQSITSALWVLSLLLHLVIYLNQVWTQGWKGEVKLGRIGEWLSHTN